MATGKPEQQLKDEALLRAARRGALSRARRLLAGGANVEARDGEGLSPVFHAASRGFAAVTRLLLEHGGAPDVGREIGLGPGLVQAAYKGRADVLQVLLEFNADINAIDYARRTALHAAIWARQEEAALMLLDAGADPNSRDRMEKTPLMQAIDMKWQGLALRLAERGADATVTDKYDRTLRTLAQEEGWQDVVSAIDRAAAEAEENLRRALFSPVTPATPDPDGLAVLQKDLKVAKPLALKTRDMG